MSIESLFDHTGTIYRSTEGTDAYGDPSQVWSEVSAAVPFALVPPNLRRRDAGAGDQATGRMELYMGAAAGLQMGDVLAVDTGPEAGTLWEVDAPPIHPRGNHTEAKVVPWNRLRPEVTP